MLRFPSVRWRGAAVFLAFSRCVRIQPRVVEVAQPDCIGGYIACYYSKKTLFCVHSMLSGTAVGIMYYLDLILQKTEATVVVVSK